MRIFANVLRWPGLVRKAVRVYKSPKDYGVERFESKGQYRINLEPYLKMFLKPGWQNKVDAEGYKVYLSFDLGDNFEFDGIYSDARYGLILAHSYSIVSLKDRGLACIGFDIEDSSVVVRQIQGVSNNYVPGVMKNLEPLRWEKMLLRIVVDWARENGFKKVMVIRAEESGWFRESRKEAMYLKYDVTARRSGFKFDEEEGRYVLSLEGAKSAG